MKSEDLTPKKEFSKAEDHLREMLSLLDGDWKPSHLPMWRKACREASSFMWKMVNEKE